VSYGKYAEVLGMKTILSQFEGEMNSAWNNFHMAMLTLVFINQRPFHQDFHLPVPISRYKIVRAQLLNSLGDDIIREYGGGLRRYFLNDMFMAYERYSMLMIVSHNNGQNRTDPSQINDRTLGAHLFEQLSKIYNQNDKKFLVQLRRLRNSLIHYNGHYSAANKLNYTFGSQTYQSKGNEGGKISITFDNLLWIQNELLEIVRKGNANYFAHYPIM
jgi:hypothetical protein